ncbi:MAG: serine/threonine protein kinase [Planctomycetes bacterium]|nr:serine/threonine protein kinase [Planctomycetota bacterium]
MINRILKGYQIVDKIKDGSVGTVWRAINSKNQVFALKQISEKNAARSDKVKQFKKEASLQLKLQQRHIIRVFEYVDVKPQPFFSMEYFDSENLKYAMWYLPERVYKAEFYILRQLAEALGYIHSLDIIHKDLKPENVLVAANSEIRLIDFSLAQTKWDRFLQFGKRVEGTPLYMAPEQIRGERCDPRTDIYSFGATMYELLTKRPPFLGTTEKSLLDKHLKEPPRPMRTWVKTLAPELDNLVLKMLSKKPEDRFPDMTAVNYELSKWEKKDTQIRLRQVEPGNAANRPNVKR